MRSEDYGGRYFEIFGIMRRSNQSVGRRSMLG